MKTYRSVIPILALLFLAILTACGPGPHAVMNGTLRDTIFSVEPRANGSTSIWMTHDDVGVYCTLNQELASKALLILSSPDNEVILRYASINAGDPESNILLTNGCATEERKQVTVYKIISITSVER